jgi:hypothetical protein
MKCDRLALGWDACKSISIKLFTCRKLTARNKKEIITDMGQG